LEPVSRLFSVFVVGYGVIWPCPFCPCDFSCLADLERHLEIFGNSMSVHVDALRRLHFDLDGGYSSNWRADYF
jgi:hypothetical protein